MTSEHTTRNGAALDRRLDRRRFSRRLGGLGLAAAGLATLGGRALAQEASPSPAATPAAGEALIWELPGDNVFPEGIAYDPASGDFYVGSTQDGAIYRGNIADPAGGMELFLEPGGDGRDSVTGLKEDERGRLWIAGRRTGRAFVYDTASRGLIRGFETPPVDQTLINDVVVTADAAYFTDSFRPTLFRVTHTASDVGEIEEWLDLSGTPAEYGEGFNLNGIAATPDGQTLLTVHYGNGNLYRIDVAEQAVTAVDLGEATLTGGDGILLDGATLYVVLGEEGGIVPVTMNADYTAGDVGELFTDPSFNYPTTIAKYDDNLLVVNSQLNMEGGGGSPTLPFTVSSVPMPAS